jgi:uncharacterized protein YbjT (DUF2867 family)
MLVLVLGGTGTIGRLTSAELAGRGHEVRALSRSGAPVSGATGVAGDLSTGTGLSEALDGVDVVIDCSNYITTSGTKAVTFFETSVHNVTERASQAGVRHLIVLSIAGIDHAPFGYYLGKLHHEMAALSGAVPATVLRATQFHEFVGQNLDRFSFGPVAMMPRMTAQPIAGSEVATALADLAEGEPLGRAPDIGGPRREQLVELARAQVRRRGGPRLVLPLWVPGALGKAMRDGTLTLDPDQPGRGPTFAEWLELRRD